MHDKIIYKYVMGLLSCYPTFTAVPFAFQTRMQSLRPHPNAVYRNIYHAFGSMMKKEGLFAPLRGMNVVALGAGPAHALYFSTYEAMKKFINGNQTAYNPLSHGKCGTVFTQRV